MYTGREGSIAVIVGPLISLMMDQKMKFTPTGISVEFVRHKKMRLPPKLF